MRHIIKDVSRPQRTELMTTRGRGRDRQEVRASVPGNDVWAYQMAKIQLQNAVLAQRRAAHLRSDLKQQDPALTPALHPRDPLVAKVQP